MDSHAVDEKVEMNERIVFRDGKRGWAVVACSDASEVESKESIAFGEPCLGPVDWADYDEAGYRAELIDGLLVAEAELDAGLGRLHEDVFSDLVQTYASLSSEPAG